MEIEGLMEARRHLTSDFDVQLNAEINDTLRNWGLWCRGGWPPLRYSLLPTSRDYYPKDQRDKRHRLSVIDVPSAEAANLAVFNLALKGETRSYQIIAAWWAHHRPAKLIAKMLHCSLASVYNYRRHAMRQFWSEYLGELDRSRRRKNSFLTG